MHQRLMHHCHFPLIQTKLPLPKLHYLLIWPIINLQHWQLHLTLVLRIWSFDKSCRSQVGMYGGLRKWKLALCCVNLRNFNVFVCKKLGGLQLFLIRFCWAIFNLLFTTALALLPRVVLLRLLKNLLIVSWLVIMTFVKLFLVTLCSCFNVMVALFLLLSVL